MKPYYQHAGITIYHGDCREVLPLVLPPRDENGFREESWKTAFVTDPPYGIRHRSNGGPDRQSVGAASWANTEIAGDDSMELRDWLVRSCAGYPSALFGSWKMPPPVGTRQVLIWDKGAMCGMGDLSIPWKPSFDEIYILGEAWEGPRDEAVLKGHFVISWESRGRTHPHEKPVSLIKHLINKCDAEYIYDPFCGTGAILIAAKDLGRRAIGIEIEERYCETAAKRLSQEVLEFT